MRAIVIAVALAVLLAGSLAHAQTPVERDVAAAHAERGLDASDAGKYAEAIEHFEKAEQLFHAPTHVSFMARAHEKLGHLERARQLYQQLSTEELPQNPSPAFRKAQADAMKAFAALDQRVPALTVIVQGLKPEEIELTVNGKPRPEWWKHALRLDPGEYEIVASANGYIPDSTKVTLKEKQTELISLILKPTHQPASPAPPAPAEPDGGENEDSSWLVPPLIAFGVGVAGLVVGGVTGALSFSKVGELDDACPAKTNCNPADQHLADDAETLGNVSTAFFVIGGVGVAAGTVLMFWQPFADDEATDESTARLRVGLGSLTVTGSF